MPFSYHFPDITPSPVDDDLTSPNHESLHDDSVVLSDLIRTGETSRLRRRGAMRIEANGTTSSRHHRWRSPIYTRGADDPAVLGDLPGYTWTIVENRSHRIPRHLPMLEVSDDDLEDSDSDSGDEMAFSASLDRAISEQTGHSISSDSSSLRSRRSNQSVIEKLSLDLTSYSLVCGGPLDDTPFQGRSGPESVYSALTSFILPQPSSSHSSSSPEQVSTESSDTNGCGTVVHRRTFHRYRHHQAMWTASTPAEEVVVPLERMYFDEIYLKDKASSKMIKQEACGCLRIGIGCANCGNPLGFRLNACKLLRDCIASRQSLRRQGSCAPRSSVNDVADGQELYLYTFFPGSTTSPDKPVPPAPELTPQRRRARSRPRSYPWLPPPPPLIHLMSDEEVSDSDEEVVIDFRTPTLSSTPSTVLGGNFTASPEPRVIHLEPNPSPHIQRRSSGVATVHPTDIEDDSELGQARASWANVVRGVEAAASSLGENLEDQSISSNSHRTSTRGRPRRDALGFDAERELGLVARTGLRGGAAFPSHTDIPSVLLERAAIAPTPAPVSQEFTLSTRDYSDPGENTPRPTVWEMLPPEDRSSTSFWGRPALGDSQWTWSSQSTGNLERQRGGTNATRRVFDPDGEFLEGLEGEWGEDMARRLGFNSMDEKNEANEGGETPTSSHGSLWW